MVSEEKGSENAVSVKIPILRILKSAHQQHGLRHGDYHRYHQYTTRKIRRMRKSLDFRQGNRSKVVVKNINAEMLTDSRFITLKLFEIERCWAYAMQLKSESESLPRRHSHAKCRLRKAVRIGNELNDLLNQNDVLDAPTKLELQAYIFWIRGILSYEIENWVEAKDCLEKTQQIYTALAENLDEEIKELYTSRCEEILPQIRYCAYSIGDKSAAQDLLKMRNTGNDLGFTMDQLTHLLSQTHTLEANKVTEVEWLNESIPIRIESARITVIAHQDAAKDIEDLKPNDVKGHLSIIENVIKICNEGITSVKEELKTIESLQNTTIATATGNQASGKAFKAPSHKDTTVSVEKMSKVQLLLSYLQFIKLKNVIERSILQVQSGLIAASKSISVQSQTLVATSVYPKPQELARLYDTVVQNLTDVASLFGLIREESDTLEYLNSKMVAYKSLRCYYLALAHMSNKHFKECLALLKRSNSFCSTAVEQLENFKEVSFENEVPGHKKSDLLALLDTLKSHIKGEELTCKAQRILALSSTEEANPVEAADNALLGDSKLINNLQTFVDAKKLNKVMGSSYTPLVDFPASFEPVPVKTVFFDLASNYIDYPNVLDRNKAKTDSAAGQGISGFVKGLFWK